MSADKTCQLIAEARGILGPFIERLAARPEVEGVVLLSSIVQTGQRVTFDEMSDIDLTVWIHAGLSGRDWHPVPRVTRRLAADRAPAWLGNFSFHLPLHWGLVEVNVHQRIFEYDSDPRTTWDDPMREAHAYTAQIVFDRAGRIGRLIDARTQMESVERIGRLVRLASRLEWDIRRTPGCMAERGDAAAGHLVLAQAVDEVIEVFYLLAGRFVPHRKWRLDGLSRHGLCSPIELDLLAEAIRVAELTRAELDRRIVALNRLWTALWERFPAEIRGQDVYQVYNATGSVNRQIRPRTIADDMHARYGETLGAGMYDLVNYLLPASVEELARLSDEVVAELPLCWQGLAGRLRAEAETAVADATAAHSSVGIGNCSLVSAAMPMEES